MARFEVPERGTFCHQEKLGGRAAPPKQISSNIARSGLLASFLLFDHRNDLFVSKTCLHLSVLLLGGVDTNLEEF
jgi:hypothetical protein